MKNYILTLAIALSVFAIGLNLLKPPAVGNIFRESNSYSQALTYSTNTLNTGAEELVARATSSRTYCEICHSPTNSTLDPVFLFKQATSTGVAVNSGKAIFATSSIEGSCMRLDTSDPYTGAIWGISTASTTVTIGCIQS